MPGTRVFVLVGEAREATLQAAYAAGALGFVTKDGSVQHVPPIWAGRARGRPLPPGLHLRAAPGAASVNDDRFTTAGA